MLLKQKCLVIPLLDLKCPLAQISGMFGLSMKEVKTISSDYELIRKINNIKFTKKCLEVSDFSKPQPNLRLNHIQTLLYHIIQKFSRWARRINFIDKSDDNISTANRPTTQMGIDKSDTNDFITGCPTTKVQVNKGDNNNLITGCHTTKIQVDNTFILNIWLLLKNTISHHPTVPYERLNRTIHSLSFKRQKKSGLAKHLIGCRPTRKFLITSLKELRSKNHFHRYSI